MTRRSVLKLAACLMAILGLSATGVLAASGQAPAAAASAATGKSHKIVFAVTSGDEADWNLSLGNIRNLLAGLKPDPVEVEVVAFGGGIVLVKSDSSVAADIAKLQADGVKFVACQNSMRARHLELKDLLPGVTPVPSGIVEVVTKQEQGWVYIKGGR
jgi:intracellular sulfur oxidation DsrE/DsrF family protein